MPRPTPDFIGYVDRGTIWINQSTKSTHTPLDVNYCKDIVGCGDEDYNYTGFTWTLNQLEDCEVYPLGTISLRVTNLRQAKTTPSGIVIPALEAAEINGFIDFLQNALTATWNATCP